MSESYPSTSTKKRTIFVTGSTGRQGRAFVEAVTSSENDDFHILALTRDSKGQKARDTISRYSSHVTVVQGDLDKPDSIRRIFEAQKKAGQDIWGVFCVLAFPGLGVKATGEEKQGKMVADLSLEFNVSHFVFSSVERGGEDADEIMMDDRLAKIRIEKHVKELGTKGLKWTIVRPGFFMENYEGFLGAITFGVLKAGLKPTTTIELIAVDDIGYISYGIFKDSSLYGGQILVAIGETVTIVQHEEAHQKATGGRPMSSIPLFLARLLISLNGETKRLIAEMERAHTFWTSQPPDADCWRQVAAAKRAHPNIKSFEEWCLSAHKREREMTPSREEGLEWCLIVEITGWKALASSALSPHGI
ncbi:hypothetical protein PQX77_003322 [Marasmius sp. AFHP31]|nr:hypothetical protein PQX77_003322 [Marasmius sp. AFHP31]